MPQPFDPKSLPSDWYRKIPRLEEFTSPQIYRVMAFNGDRAEHRAAYLVRVDADIEAHSPMSVLGELTVTGLRTIRTIELEIEHTGRYLLHKLT